MQRLDFLALIPGFKKLLKKAIRKAFLLQVTDY
jgi:hypothetical protein